MPATALRRGWTALVALVGFLLLGLVAAPFAHACDCMPLSFEEAADDADLVAEITIQHEISDDSGDITYRAVVETVWKGEESRTIRFTTHSVTASCGLGRLEDDTQLTVWASGADGEYSTTWCALPEDGGEDDEERLTALLGEPADLSDQPVPDPGPDEGPTTEKPDDGGPAFGDRGDRVDTGLVIGAVAALLGGLLLALAVVATAAVLMLRRRR